VKRCSKSWLVAVRSRRKHAFRLSHTVAAGVDPGFSLAPTKDGAAKEIERIRSSYTVSSSMVQARRAATIAFAANATHAIRPIAAPHATALAASIKRP